MDDRGVPRAWDHHDAGPQLDGRPSGKAQRDGLDVGRHRLGTERQREAIVFSILVILVTVYIVSALLKEGLSVIQPSTYGNFHET